MPYVTDNRKWTPPQCELSVTSSGWPTAWVATARRAIQNWNGVNPGFTFAEVPGSTNYLTTQYLGLGPLALTQTQPLGNGSALIYAVVIINLDYEWDPPHPRLAFTDRQGPHDLETVLTHELGHVLHLDHDMTTGTPALMRPTFLPRQKCAIHADDIQGSRFLYP